MDRQVEASELQVSEFELTELEERLEMASSDFTWCCQCFRNPMCDVSDMK
jgi:hypothetical protein